MTELVAIRLANLHPRMDRNTIITWLKHEGEHVRRHEPLYVVETRKSTFEVCSEVEGVVDFLLVRQGGRVAAQQELALIRCENSGDEATIRDARMGAQESSSSRTPSGNRLER